MSSLPLGPLVAFYGDDFTGSAAVMEVLAFAGLDTVLFLDIPSEADLDCFASARAIGIAGIARSQGTDWLDNSLPPIFAALDSLGAPLVHYKVCSTFDSSPTIGSIGRAIERAQDYWGGWHPLLVAAPVMQRYQAFGQLFANAGSEVFRLDRHPVMRRHPTTPMDEADVRVHLARQTELPIGLISLADWRRDRGSDALVRETGAGCRILAFDAIDEADMEAAGALIWQHRGERIFAVGSQGVEYALVAHWRASGDLPSVSPPTSAGRHDRIIAVSGSVSATTAAQIDWAAVNGFAPISLDAETLLRDDPSATIIAALKAFDAGHSPLIHSARGPDDPNVAAIQRLGRPDAASRIGAMLGDILADLIARTGLKRAVISGGDTSGQAAQKLGVYAFTALAPTIAGAALLKAHRRDGTTLELALKGGQMGTEDYFGWIRDGGGPRN
jgi:3-oxoisoapionate kinase